MSALRKNIESLPANIIELVKEIATAGLNAGMNISECINDYIDSIFNGKDNTKTS